MIRIGIKQHCPLPHQPENWLIDESPWSLLQRDAADDYCDFLNNRVTIGAFLLGDSRVAIPVQEFECNSLRCSLELISPRDLHLRVEEFNAKKKRERSSVSAQSTTTCRLPIPISTACCYAAALGNIRSVRSAYRKTPIRC